MKQDYKKSLVSFQPVALDQLIQNGQPSFGVFSQVKDINYLDYYSHLISQKSLPNWRKELKANQFCFIQIIESPYRICLALATIKLATSAFVYLYNDNTEQLEICEGLQPLTRHTVLEGDCYQGKMAFTHSKLTLTLDFTPKQVNVALDSQYIAVNTMLTRQDQPLAVCTPTGRRGWTFTQKEPFTAITGHLSIKADSRFNVDAPSTPPKQIDFTDTTIANLDWTLGYMRHETNWFWSCINSYLLDGRHFALNLAMGVNETGVSENACWLDGQIFYLPPVMFARDALNLPPNQKNEISKNLDITPQSWRIYHQNLGWSHVDIDLTFTPIRSHKKTDNFGVIASIFEQWIGEYSGEIRIKDKVIKLNNVIGLAEDHFAKW